MKRWTFGAASVRGTSHVKNSTRIQDAKRCFETIHGDSPSVFSAIISDGAGSASHGGQGASIVCRTIAEAVRAHFEVSAETIPTAEIIWDWLDQVRDRISHAATSRSLTPRDFAATMILVISNGSQTLSAHIGDGAVVARNMADQKWLTISEPENGEYASTTYFVTDAGVPRMRIGEWAEDIDAIFVFSDGIENLVFDNTTREPFEGFFKPMTKPFASSETLGRDHYLSERLSTYLNGAKFAELTDDDKSLIIAVRK